MGLKTSLQSLDKESLEKIILKIHRTNKNAAFQIDCVLDPSLRKSNKSIKDIKVIDAIKKGQSIKGICKKYRISLSRAYKLAKQEGINVKNLHYSKTKKDILELYKQEKSLSQIAKELKVSRQYVFQVVHSNN